MLLLAPIFLLLFAALAIFIWQAVRPGFGVPWLAAVVVTLATWGFLLYLRFRLPMILMGKQWQPLGEASDFPAFALDLVSWPYAFALAGLLAATVLTASARLAHQTNPRAWAGSLAMAGIALFSILSVSPLTLAVTWTAIDLIELAVMLGSARDQRASRAVAIAFAARLAGTLVLIWSILLGRSLGITLTFAQVPPEVGVYLLLAAGLRLGVLPLYLPYQSDIPMRRGLSNMLRLSSPAAALVVLARLPANAVPAGWAPALLAITAIAVLYTALAWLFSPNELSGRPYWLIALAGMAVACVISGHPLASLAWGLTLLLTGGLLFLYSARSRVTLFLPVLGLIGLSGLPFTPSAAGWAGMSITPFNFWTVLFLLAHAALVAGYLRHALGPGDALSGMERWVQSIYPFGLLLLAATQWIDTVFNLRASFGLGLAWLGVISTLLALLGMGLYIRQSARAALPAPESIPAGESEAAPQHGWLVILAERVGHALSLFFRLDWFYSLFTLAYNLLRRLVQLLTLNLEGDAGVLWALVLLALLVSLLRTGGTR